MRTDRFALLICLAFFSELALAHDGLGGAGLIFGGIIGAFLAFISSVVFVLIKFDKSNNKGFFYFFFTSFFGVTLSVVLNFLLIELGTALFGDIAAIGLFYLLFWLSVPFGLLAPVWIKMRHRAAAPDKTT